MHACPCSSASGRCVSMVLVQQQQGCMQTAARTQPQTCCSRAHLLVARACMPSTASASDPSTCPMGAAAALEAVRAGGGAAGPAPAALQVGERWCWGHSCASAGMQGMLCHLTVLWLALLFARSSRSTSAIYQHKLPMPAAAQVPAAAGRQCGDARAALHSIHAHGCAAAHVHAF